MWIILCSFEIYGKLESIIISGLGLIFDGGKRVNHDELVFTSWANRIFCFCCLDSEFVNFGALKLENERQKIREQRKKEKIRDKKEKRKKKHRKHKDKKHRKHKDKKHKSNGFLIKPDISNGHVSRIAEDKVVYMRTEVENDQFNGSSLTEEHGASISHCSSSDNSEAGNKRKRRSSLNNGNSLLTPLPSGTQNYFDASDKEQTRYAYSGGTGFSVGNKGDFHLRNLSQRSDEHKPVVKKSAPESVKTSQKQRMAQEYKNLVDNWAPPLNFQDSSLYSDDMDWLFHGNKNRDMPPEKRRKCGSDITPCSRGSSLWPRAVYLHEVNVYALPLTIPF